MLSIKNWQSLSSSEKKRCLSRPIQTNSIRDNVAELIQQVQNDGDKALFELTKRFDGVNLNAIKVPENDISKATIAPQSLRAIKEAIRTITLMQQSLIPETKNISTSAGINIKTVYRPIQRVGLYIPGGNKTPLVSSLLMQAIPAQVAGCPVRVLCTPPDSTGTINPNLLVAAQLCGIDTIYTIGGAQAVAAMAYGTETVMKVDKIFGPGNSYVTEAKTMVACDPNGAAIDMPAGPSEVMVIADDDANPAFVAADLLAQAEHGVDSQSILICNTLDFANKVNQQLKEQLAKLSRQNIVKQSLTIGAIILCNEMNERIKIINEYAPEHLIINCQNAESWVDKINAAGTVFLGPWAAETMGDYITGSNHVLPTNGFAKNHSGLSVLDFSTRFSVQSINPQGLINLGPMAMTLAQIEGLNAHAAAVQIRLNALEV